MVHLLVLRHAPSFVQGEKLFYGTHEMVENHINKREYKHEGILRTGYNQPFASELKLIDYRVKSEVLPEFIRDLKAINLNPENNDSSLWKILMYKHFKKKNKGLREDGRFDGCYLAIGPLFLFIRLAFKWFNKIGVTGMRPVPAPASGVPESFLKIESNNSTTFANNYLIGVLPDEKEEYSPGVFSDKL